MPSHPRPTPLYAYVHRKRQWLPLDAPVSVATAVASSPPTSDLLHSKGKQRQEDDATHYHRRHGESSELDPRPSSSLARPIHALSSSDRAAMTSTSTVTSTTIAPPPLTVMTYNVFSGSASSSTPHAQHRTKGVLSLIRRSRPSVVALQEVSVAFEHSLRRERWFREEFTVTGLSDYFATSSHADKSRATPATATPAAAAAARGRNADDGCLLAIRKDLVGGLPSTATSHTPPSSPKATMLKLPGPQGKVLVMVDLVEPEVSRME